MCYLYSTTYTKKVNDPLHHRRTSPLIYILYVVEIRIIRMIMSFSAIFCQQILFLNQ